MPNEFEDACEVGILRLATEKSVEPIPARRGLASGAAWSRGLYRRQSDSNRSPGC